MKKGPHLTSVSLALGLLLAAPLVRAQLDGATDGEADLAVATDAEEVDAGSEDAETPDAAPEDAGEPGDAATTVDGEAVADADGDAAAGADTPAGEAGSRDGGGDGGARDGGVTTDGGPRTYRDLENETGSCAMTPAGRPSSGGALMVALAAIVLGFARRRAR